MPVSQSGVLGGAGDCIYAPKGGTFDREHNMLLGDIFELYNSNISAIRVIVN